MFSPFRCFCKSQSTEVPNGFSRPSETAAIFCFFGDTFCQIHDTYFSNDVNRCTLFWRRSQDGGKVDGTGVYLVGLRYLARYLGIMALNGQPLTKFARHVIFAG